MGILDRLFGNRDDQRNSPPRAAAPRSPRFTGGGPAEPLTDEQAVERYRYLLRTAPPEAIEEAHAEAFAQLTPEQRRMVLEGLNNEAPAAERTDRDDARSLARMATRAELRQPGTMERRFAGNPGAMGGMGGGFFGGSLLNTIAGVVIGTAVANAIFNDGGSGQESADASDGDQGSDSGDSGDAGFDSGDSGGDFGGGDFGGGGFDAGGGEF